MTTKQNFSGQLSYNSRTQACGALASGSWDKTVRLWSTDGTGMRPHEAPRGARFTLIRTLEGHEH